MFEVYKHTAPSGKAYVGFTSVGAAARWRSHVKAARRGSPLPFHRAIRKHGPGSFTHELLERMTTETGAKRAEQLWIRELGTFGRGYNATTGGEGAPGVRPWNKGRRVTEAERLRLVKIATGVKQSESTLAKRFSKAALVNMSRAHKGHSASAETKARMSEAQRAVHARDPNRRLQLAEFSRRPKSEVTKARMSEAASKRYRKAV